MSSADPSADSAGHDGRARIGADVGGTFTDVILQHPDGAITVEKQLSTPPNYDEAVVDAVRGLLEGDNAAAALGEVVHGTTVATNAVLERRGARTALVTTAGFRDVLELRRMRMPQLYDLFWNKPPPLVERHLRLEVEERTAADGTTVKALTEEEARAVARRIAASGVESVAVCLLHAHRFPEHERLLGAILRAELPGVPVSLSSEILREQQEYERSATTVVNAYIRPLMAGYVDDIRRGLDAVGVRAPLMVMQSSGGVMSAADAAARPVYALESGPAAGVVGALGLAQTLGRRDVISFDMGGTTAKASLIDGGRVARGREYEVGASLSVGSRLLRGSGELIRMPTIEIAEVGAGGGSVAWLDPAGAFHVGPRSAGAAPGPACYGRGGEEPTVTDANVVLGYIPRGPIGSGDLSISAELAEAALERLAEPLGLATVAAARGVHELANATMMRALRAVSSEKGRDPRDFALMAYGGSGPVHAAALADELGISTAIVPPLAGLFSAAGLLFARTEFHDVRYCRIDVADPDRDLLDRLDEEMRTELEQLIGSRASLEWARSADVRYRGQNWDVEVEFPAELDAEGLTALVERFEAEHERLYGVRLERGSPVEIRALRVAVIGAPRTAGRGERSDHRRERGGERRRRADFGERHGEIDTLVIARSSIAAEPMTGPLLIDEYDTTIVVPPDWTAARHESGAIVLERARAARPTYDGEIAEVVTRQIAANALVATADEMATTIFRTAHSPVLRDAMDFSAALCDPSGETVAQAVTIPLQLGSIPTAMAALFERYGDRFRPGDVYIVNDPFDGASHTPDIFVVKPAFVGETLIGFGVTIAHHGDVGGRVPGTIACDNTEIFQEGLRIPWVRLYAEGAPVEEIFKLIRANVRIPRETLGDLSAQVAACTIGERGLVALAERYGTRRLGELMSGLLDHSERLMRTEIERWPDGRARFTDYLDSDGIDVCDVPLSVELTISGDEVIADFSDSAPMVRGALNCTKSFAEASVYQAVMAAASVEIPHTTGAIRPITVVTKPGTVTDVVMPGASSMRGVTGYRLFDVMNGALAQLIPDRVPAAGEGGSTLAVFTGASDGERFVYDELVVGTWGARPGADGNDGLANACAAMANIPVEAAESDYPIFVERYGFVPDSGGAGRFRGGLAIERAWRALVPETLLQVRSDRQRHSPYGLDGGGDGARSSNTIVRADGTRERLAPMFGGVLEPGDVFHHRMAGGGGFGDPLERDPDAVARDVLNEGVSERAARELYGVAVRADGSVDRVRTAALRQSLRALRPSGATPSAP